MPLICDHIEKLLLPLDNKPSGRPFIKHKADLTVNEVQIKHEHIEIDDNENEFKIDFEKEMEETGKYQLYAGFLYNSHIFAT